MHERWTLVGAWRNHRWAAQRILLWLRDDDVFVLVVCALEDGDISFAEWLLFGCDSHPQPIDPISCLHYAVAHGCANTTTWLLQHQTTKKRMYAPVSAKRRPECGVFDRAEAIRRARGYTFPSIVMADAASHGCLDAVQWLVQPGVCSFSLGTTLYNAAKHNHVTIVDWLLGNAAAAADVDVYLPYSEELRAVCWTIGSRAYCWSPLWGLQVVYLASVSQYVRFPLIDAYAKVGDMATIERIARMVPDTREVSNFCTHHAFTLAAKGGHWDVLQWLWMNSGQRVDVTLVFEAAVEAGQLDIMNRLAPKITRDRAFICAAKTSQTAALQWLIDKYPTYTPQWSSVLEEAVKKDHRHVIDFIMDHHEPIASEIVDAFASCSLPVAEKLLMTCDTRETLDTAMKGMYWNKDAAVRRFCLDMCASVVPALPLQVVLSEENYSLEEVKYHVATAKDRALRTGEPLDQLLQLSHLHIPSITISWKSAEEVRWLLDLVLAGRGSIDLEPHAMNHLYVVLSTEYYETHRSEPKCYYDDGRHSTVDYTVEAEPVFTRKTELIDGFVRHCVALRVPSLCEVAWVPAWAIRAQCLQSLDILEAMQHPYLFRPKSINTVIKHTRNARIILWFLSRASELFTPEVSRWAGRYGLQTVLAYMVDRFKSEPRRQRLAVRSAAIAAAKHGQAEAIVWLWPHLMQHFDVETATALLDGPASTSGCDEDVIQALASLSSIK